MNGGLAPGSPVCNSAEARRYRSQNTGLLADKISEIARAVYWRLRYRMHGKWLCADDVIPLERPFDVAALAVTVKPFTHREPG